MKAILYVPVLVHMPVLFYDFLLRFALPVKPLEY